MTKQNMNITLRGGPSELKMKMNSFIRNVQKSQIIHSEKSERISIEDIFIDEDENELE